jgi:hypothetical protein
MNDETTGQLTSNWQIPPYARQRLWLTTETGSAQTEGAHGLFTLPAPAPLLTLRWGSEDGAALRQVKWQPDTLAWEGDVCLGGYLESLHLTELPGIDDPVMIATVDAQPLKPTLQPYPNASQRPHPIPRPDFFTGIDAECDLTLTTWLVLAESLYAGSLQDALSNRIRVYLFGRLAEDRSGWQKHLALPILLEAMTMFPL